MESVAQAAVAQYRRDFFGGARPGGCC